MIFRVFVQLPSLGDGGLLWFSDLGTFDPYYGLPIISAATFLLAIEVCGFVGFGIGV